MQKSLSLVCLVLSVRSKMRSDSEITDHHGKLELCDHADRCEPCEDMEVCDNAPVLINDIGEIISMVNGQKLCTERHK